MTEDYKKIAASISSGKYFGDAKGWFEAVYIGPISERSFFLIIAAMAAMIAVFGFMSVNRLMPITKREAILIHASERMDEVQPTLIQLAKNHVPINPAINDFFLTRYVELREGFDAKTFEFSARFVRSQSNDAAYTAYATTYNPAVAQSPFNGLGELGKRLVTVTSVEPAKVKAKDNPQGHSFANVEFTVETTGVSEPTKTRWTANIEYIYTGLESKMVENAETGSQELEVTDPHFQVVNYVLTQNK